MKLTRVEAALPRPHNRIIVSSGLLIAALVLGLSGSTLASPAAPPATIPASTPLSVAQPTRAPEEAAGWLLAAATPSYVGAQKPPARTFVALGDSLTAWAFAPGSWRATPAASWPNVLSQLDPDLDLLSNAGVPGNTTSQMVARLKTDVLAYHPDVLFVMAGTNDLGRHWASSVTVSNVRTIIHRARSQGIEVVLLTIPPNNRATSSQLRALRATNVALAQMAEAEGADVIDVYAVLVDSGGHLPAAYAARDRLHLTKSAEEAIARAIFDQLGPASRSQS
jgi:lysophospholipase L1-like esterase